MLIKLIQQVNQKLSKIDPDTDAPAFIAEWLRRRPDAREGIEKEAFPKEKGSSAAKDLIMQSILQLMAKGALNKIKRMPEMIAVMLERLQDRRTDPAIRCGVAGILAYVVQPRDLIPDDAPGGYGFIDDAVLIHAGYLDLLALEPPNAKNFNTHEGYLKFISLFVPHDAIPALQQAVQSMEMSLNFYRMLPPDVLETTAQIIMDNPLLPVQGMPASSVVASAPASARPTYTYQDGNNLFVNFPGGGGVATDGRDIFVL